ncbi:MAG: nucleoside triphosphate pyrophosphohydrolase [Spirochaetaceae bacterium]
MNANEREALERFIGIVRRLRGPDGCPWDRKQTLASMRRYLIEESYEVVESIDEDDSAGIREELGDVYLITTMLAVIGEDAGRFTIPEVFNEISEKLIRRHPHVFASSGASTPGAVEAQWEEIKRREKVEKDSGDGGNASESGANGGHSWDPGVARSVPPLERARRVQKAAAREGFDWPASWGLDPVYRKVREEVAELQRAVAGAEESERAPGGPRYSDIEDELGDLLFATVNLARKLKVDPSLALSRAVDKFSGRYAAVAAEVRRRGLKDPSIEELDAIWTEVKSRSPEGRRP